MPRFKSASVDVVFARVSFAAALDLDPDAVNQQMNVADQAFLAAGTAQFRPIRQQALAGNGPFGVN